MRPFFVVVLLASGLLAGAQDFKELAKSEKWSDIIQQGNAKIDEANADAETYYFVGRAYMAKNNYKRGIAHLEKSVELDSGFSPSHKLLAVSYSSRNATVSKGVEHYHKSLETGKCSYAYRYQVISGLRSAGACAKSLELAQAFETDTVFLALYRKMALCHKDLKAPEMALTYMNKYNTENETSNLKEADAIHYAEIYGYLNNPEQSVEWYNHAFKKNPSNEKTAAKLAEFYGQNKDYTSMAQTLEQHLSASGSEKTSIRFLLASAYFNLEDYEKADGIYTQVCEKYPDMVVGYLKRAQCASKLDTDSKGLAKPHYEKVLAIVDAADGKQNPRYKSAYQSANAYLGSYYLNTEKDLEKSKTHWNNVLEVNEYNSMARKALEHIKELEGN